jgi:DNA-binding NtrC family response regulator
MIIFCGYCGKQNLDEHSYCVKCGRRLRAQAELDDNSNPKDSSHKILPSQTLPVETQSFPLHSLEFELPEKGFELKKYIEQLEISIILKALERAGGVKNMASKILGINRTTLVEKIKKYGIKSD